MAKYTPGTQEWLDQVTEEIIEPDRRIIDPHHHLWYGKGVPDYLLEDLWSDTGSGHRVEKTVFVETDTCYRDTGPAHLACVGETEFAVQVAEESENGGAGKSVISAIVGHADLLLAEGVEEVVQEHIAAARGRFRGIRHIASRDSNLEAAKRWATEDLYKNEKYRQGARTLGKLGLTQDCWHLHHQNRSFLSMARAVEGTTIILNHFASPVGIGPYAGHQDEIFAEWRRDISEIAKCPNVVAKLGGLAMPVNGVGWSERETPPTSDEVVETHRRYYLHAIESFGPERCMFESNFPVEKASVSYVIIWNAYKKMVLDFSEDEKDLLFYRTAERVYRV